MPALLQVWKCQDCSRRDLLQKIEVYLAYSYSFLPCLALEFKSSKTLNFISTAPWCLAEGVPVLSTCRNSCQSNKMLLAKLLMVSAGIKGSFVNGPESFSWARSNERNGRTVYLRKKSCWISSSCSMTRSTLPALPEDLGPPALGWFCPEQD